MAKTAGIALPGTGLGRKEAGKRLRGELSDSSEDNVQICVLLVKVSGVPIL